jgi:hypothetical protein
VSGRTPLSRERPSWAVYGAGALLVLGSAGAILYQGASLRSAERRAADQAARIDALQNELEPLKSTLLRLEMDRSSTRLTATRELSAAVHEMVRGEMSNEARVAPAPSLVASTASPASKTEGPSSEEIRDSMEARFHGENADPSWSHEATEKLHDGISPLVPNGSHLRDVECRSSICRVEVTLPNVDAYRAFVQTAYLRPQTHCNGPMMSTVLRTESNGDITSVAYFTRPGTPPPYPEQNHN